MVGKKLISVQHGPLQEGQQYDSQETFESSTPDAEHYDDNHKHEPCEPSPSVGKPDTRNTAGAALPKRKVERDDIVITDSYRTYASGWRKEEKLSPKITAKTGDYEEDYIRACYEADYPIIDPDASTDWDRRGKPHGFGADGTPQWPENKIPKGINVGMMSSALLTSRHPSAASWQVAGDSCAAQRATTSAVIPLQSHGGNRNADWQHAGDPCVAQRTAGGGDNSNDEPEPDQQENEASNDRACGYGNNKPGPPTGNEEGSFTGDACAWARSHTA